MSDSTMHEPKPAPQDVAVQSGLAGNVAAGRDANITTSVAGIVNAQGDSALNQSGACAVVAQGSVTMSQAGAGAVVARSFAGDSFGGGVIISNEIAVRKGWVGIALSPKLEVSEDSKVIIGPGAAVVIAAAMFGIFGTIVVLGVVAARRAAQWRPKVPVPSFAWRRIGE